MSAAIFAERKQFLATVQLHNESSVEWLNRLQMAAMRCDFGEHLNEFLVTHFICGLASATMFRRLCEVLTKPLLLADAFELAVQCERELLRADADARRSIECQTDVKDEPDGGAGGPVEAETGRPGDNVVAALSVPDCRRKASQHSIGADEPPSIACETPKKPATRKISRFLISPVELSMAVPTAQVSAENFAPLNVDVGPLPNIDAALVSPSEPSSTPSTSAPSEMSSPVHLRLPRSAWEQLKIGLENITHAQVPPGNNNNNNNGQQSAGPKTSIVQSPSSKSDLLVNGTAAFVKLPVEGDPSAIRSAQQTLQPIAQQLYGDGDATATAQLSRHEIGAGDKPKKSPLKRVRSHPRFVVRNHNELNAHAVNSCTKFGFFEMDAIDMEYPRNLDSNIEMLGIEAENMEKEFCVSAEEKLLHFVPRADAEDALLMVDRLDDSPAEASDGGADTGDDESCPSEHSVQSAESSTSSTNAAAALASSPFVVSMQLTSHSEDDPIGMSPCKRFFKYDKEVGYGSFKTVFRGLDTHTGVAVAWCELLGKKVKRAERQRFREEADMLKKLQNSNIVRFYDYWEENATRKRSIVLVTELMLSGTLKSYLKRFKKINSKVFKSWCRQILKGLYFLHSRTPPIIHRDLKCDNIFITGTTGCVKIGDLGLATLKSGSFAKSVIGTPEFMAPEMYEERYDEAVDVYAFGMCMLEMATSEYPYNECTVPAAIYKKVVSGVKPASFDKVDDKKVRQIIAQCIQLNKDDRPSCKDLLNSDFFSENVGLKLQPFSREAFLSDPRCNLIEFHLKLLDAKRRQYKHREDEAIQFYFDISVDQADVVAREMYDANIVNEDEAQTVAKLLNFQITSMLKERKERAAVAAISSSKRASLTLPVTAATIDRLADARPAMSKSMPIPIVSSSSSSVASNNVVVGSDASSPLLSPESLPSATFSTLEVPVVKVKRPSRCEPASEVPELHVLNVNDRSVECSMESMHKTITFKFDVDDVNADEVASRLISQDLLDDGQRSVFIEQVLEIMRVQQQRSSDPTSRSRESSSD